MGTTMVQVQVEPSNMDGGTNKAANADEASPPDPADYREPKHMTKVEGPPSPMELLLQKTKFRHVFGREANCCSRVYWIIVLVHLALFSILIKEAFDGAL